jgi:hypothetical protein
MTVIRLWRIIAASLLAVAYAPVVFAQTTAPEYARVDVDADDRPRALQMSVLSYVPASGDRLLEVDLISAVHIGDPSYYEELNLRFRDYDAVLFELIAPEDALGPNRKDKRNGILSTTQVGMMKLLDLSFQLDEINYDAANLVHADLSPRELRASMEARGESLYVYFWRIFFASMNEYAKDPLGLKDMEILSSAISSGQDNSFKIMAAYEITNVKLAGDMLGNDADNAVIGARNQRAIDVLENEIEGGAKRIGIFYGVAHMPDLEERLLDQIGLTYNGTDWVDAWQLGDGERGEPRKNFDNP